MTTATAERVLSLTDRGACFGIVLHQTMKRDQWIVVDAAPMGRWLVGKTEDKVRELCGPRRITIAEADPNGFA